MRVLALSPNPELMAGTRFRVAKYIPYLLNLGIDVTLECWHDVATARVLYEGGHMATKTWGSVAGAGRLAQALLRHRWDIVWVRREAMLIGPPLMEWIATRRSPVVYDVDDALWANVLSGVGRRLLKPTAKYEWILRRTIHCIAGSRALADYSRSLGANATVLPTVVERSVWRPAESHRPSPLTIGWIGTHSTAPQLDLAREALIRLRREGHEFRMLVVGAARGFHMAELDIETRIWSLDSELSTFQRLDIGIAWMHKLKRHEGKCACKQLQDMFVGVPCVSSFVFGAEEILKPEALVASSAEELYRQFQQLLTDAPLRERLTANERTDVPLRYSAEAQAPFLAEILCNARKENCTTN